MTPMGYVISPLMCEKASPRLGNLLLLPVVMSTLETIKISSVKPMLAILFPMTKEFMQT